MAIRPNKGFIRLNTPAGNDTTASGCGVNNVSGFGAAWSSGSNTIQFMSGSTSGMTVGDILWLDAGLGDRQFFEIDTIVGSQSLTTVEQTTNSQMGRNYAVGGVRETLNGVESLLTYPLQNGATAFELETNQTVQWNTTSWGNSVYYFISSDPIAKRSITHSGGVSYFFGSQAKAVCHNLIFIPAFPSGMSLSTHNTSNASLQSQIYLNNCNVGVPNGNSYDYLDNAPNASLGPVNYFASRTQFYNTPVRWKTNMTAYKCLFYNPTGTYYTDPLTAFTNRHLFTNCIFDISRFVSGKTVTQQELLNDVKFVDCVLTGSGNAFNPWWGSGGTNTDYDFCREFDGNITYEVTNFRWPKLPFNTKDFGSISGVSDTLYPIQLPTDPFVDGANTDFNLNTSQGGIDLRDLYAANLSNTTVNQYRYLLDQLPSGGGNVIVIEDN